MNLKDLQIKIAEVLGVSSTQKELAYDTFMEKIYESLHEGLTLKVPRLGFFQFKKNEPTNGSARSIIYSSLSEDFDRDSRNLYLTLHVAPKSKNTMDFDANVFSIGVGKPLLPLTVDEMPNSETSYAMLRKSIEERSKELIAESDHIPNFDLFEDYYNLSDEQNDDVEDVRFTLSNLTSDLDIIHVEDASVNSLPSTDDILLSSLMDISPEHEESAELEYKEEPELENKLKHEPEPEYDYKIDSEPELEPEHEYKLEPEPEPEYHTELNIIDEPLAMNEHDSKEEIPEPEELADNDTEKLPEFTLADLLNDSLTEPEAAEVKPNDKTEEEPESISISEYLNQEDIADTISIETFLKEEIEVPPDRIEEPFEEPEKPSEKIEENLDEFEDPFKKLERELENIEEPFERIETPAQDSEKFWGANEEPVNQKAEPSPFEVDSDAQPEFVSLSSILEDDEFEITPPLSKEPDPDIIIDAPPEPENKLDDFYELNIEKQKEEDVTEQDKSKIFGEDFEKEQPKPEPEIENTLAQKYSELPDETNTSLEIDKLLEDSDYGLQKNDELWNEEEGEPEEKIEWNWGDELKEEFGLGILDGEDAKFEMVDDKSLKKDDEPISGNKLYKDLFAQLEQTIEKEKTIYEEDDKNDEWKLKYEEPKRSTQPKETTTRKDPYGPREPFVPEQPLKPEETFRPLEPSKSDEEVFKPEDTYKQEETYNSEEAYTPKETFNKRYSKSDEGPSNKFSLKDDEKVYLEFSNPPTKYEFIAENKPENGKRRSIVLEPEPPAPTPAPELLRTEYAREMDRFTSKPPQKENYFGKIFILIFSAFVIISGSIYFLLRNNSSQKHIEDSSLQQKISADNSVVDSIIQAQAKSAATDSSREGLDEFSNFPTTATPPTPFKKETNAQIINESSNRSQNVPVEKTQPKKVESTVTAKTNIKPQPKETVDDDALYRTLKTDERIDKTIYYDGSRYNFQTSSWRNKEKAEQEAKRLRKLGLKAFITEAYLPQKGGTWYRVRVGSFKSQREAQAFMSNSNY